MNGFVNLYYRRLYSFLDYCYLMADVLEYERDLGLTDFRTKQVVMIIRQLAIGKVIPSERTSATKLEEYSRSHTCLRHRTREQAP